MPAGDDEGERGEREVAVGEEGGRDVPRHVVHGHERLAVHERDRLGRLDAHEQRAHQARPLGHRDRGEVGEARPRLLHGGLDDRDDVLDVVARGELRHDPSVRGVDRGLARHDVREDPPAVLDDRGRGLVAGGLDPEDEGHAGYSPAGAEAPASARRLSG